jgi:UDP-N-acetyl-D-galactosamine dehydrogenase
MISKDKTIAVVGLGYVGLPLAVEFGKRYRTIGYDLSGEKIAHYKNFFDPTGEIASQDLRESSNLTVTSDPAMIAEADVIVVAVPTPVNQANIPDFSALISSSTTVGKYIKRGTIVVYESTVYPGATEDICIPLLEHNSGMKWLEDFNVGYSPERVNPGDKDRTITKITKVVSADTSETLDILEDLYSSIITAGVYRASSIKVAEAAKVIENTQRDLNIALMNELAIIFHKIGIDTTEVLEAAGTKWNFLPFKPGLVGGHCIGVDPYYLTHKAESLGYHPQVILAGRRINDDMADYLAQQIIKLMIRSGLRVKDSKIAILGLTFKENCKDLRNSKVKDLVLLLRDFGCEVLIHDPIAQPEEVEVEYNSPMTCWDEMPRADVVVLAVPHVQYVESPLNYLLAKLKTSGLFIDVKSRFDPDEIQSQGYKFWRV